MNFDRVIVTGVVTHEVGPAPPVGVVWSAAVKQIAAKNEGIP